MLGLFKCQEKFRAGRETDFLGRRINTRTLQNCTHSNTHTHAMGELFSATHKLSRNCCSPFEKAARRSQLSLFSVQFLRIITWLGRDSSRHSLWLLLDLSLTNLIAVGREPEPAANKLFNTRSSKSTCSNENKEIKPEYVREKYGICSGKMPKLFCT